MILTFTGDAFLARRKAKRALAERGFTGEQVVELTPPFDAAQVASAASQGGLFAEVALLIDLSGAFPGQAGTKPRSELLETLGRHADGPLIVVVEPDATEARRRSLAALGTHRDVPTPRFEALPRWIAAELKASGVDFAPGVPQLLGDLFGEEPAQLASEINKLALLEERLDEERVRRLVNRGFSYDAFDLIDAIAAGDATSTAAIARQLGQEGEAPQRVLGALIWQFLLVAKASALLAREAPRRVSSQQAASLLKVRPFAAQKALSLAGRLDEESAKEVLGELLTADVAAKSGGDPQLALESVAISLAARWAGRPRAG